MYTVYWREIFYANNFAVLGICLQPQISIARKMLSGSVLSMITTYMHGHLQKLFAKGNQLTQYSCVYTV